MAITREKKSEILKKLTDIFKKSKSVVFVNFHGLKVSEANHLRQGLRDKDIGYFVAKKTLLKKILGEQHFSGDVPLLEGETGIAYGEDLVEPAKSVAEFAKKNKSSLKLLGGIMESRFLSFLEVSTLAAIPSREVLLGQLVGVLSGPVRGLATVLSGVPRGFVVALNQMAQKRD